jgi:hypothetical protein
MWSDPVLLSRPLKKSRDQDPDFWHRSRDEEQEFHKASSSDLEDRDLGLEITRLASSSRSSHALLVFSCRARNKFNLPTAKKDNFHVFQRSW